MAAGESFAGRLQLLTKHICSYGRGVRDEGSYSSYSPRAKAIQENALSRGCALRIVCKQNCVSR